MWTPARTSMHWHACSSNVLLASGLPRRFGRKPGRRAPHRSPASAVSQFPARSRRPRCRHTPRHGQEPGRAVSVHGGIGTRGARSDYRSDAAPAGRSSGCMGFGPHRGITVRRDSAGCTASPPDGGIDPLVARRKTGHPSSTRYDLGGCRRDLRCDDGFREPQYGRTDSRAAVVGAAQVACAATGGLDSSRPTPCAYRSVGTCRHIYQFTVGQHLGRGAVRAWLCHRIVDRRLEWPGTPGKRPVADAGSEGRRGDVHHWRNPFGDNRFHLRPREPDRHRHRHHRRSRLWLRTSIRRFPFGLQSDQGRPNPHTVRQDGTRTKVVDPTGPLLPQGFGPFSVYSPFVPSRLNVYRATTSTVRPSGQNAPPGTN